jgi:hypothetical protein
MIEARRFSSAFNRAECERAAIGRKPSTLLVNLPGRLPGFPVSGHDLAAPEAFVPGLRDGPCNRVPFT